MTQTEKTEALRELRQWVTLSVLTIDQKTAINKELVRILDSITEIEIKNETIEDLLSKGGEIHYAEWVILKDDPVWFTLVNAVTSADERSLDYRLLIKKILKESV